MLASLAPPEEREAYLAFLRATQRPQGWAALERPWPGRSLPDGPRTYVCTCYGEAELTPVDDPAAAETVRTQHHDEPRYIHPKGMPRMIENAPVLNHTDAELVMLEGLVGRNVPFSFIYTPY
jgi:hypothetical protein